MQEREALLLVVGGGELGPRTRISFSHSEFELVERLEDLPDLAALHPDSNNARAHEPCPGARVRR
jgi:hypothetical protein